MGKNSARQTYEAMTEWLAWFNKTTGRVKKTKKEAAQQTTEKSYKVEMKGFRKRKK